MTDYELRDHFAGLALQGQLASNNGWGGNPLERIAKESYRLADWMMKARMCTPEQLKIWETKMGAGGEYK